MSKKSKRKVDVDPVDYDEPFESYEEPVKASKYKIVKAYLLNQDEVNALIEASNAPYPEEPSKPFDLNYPTYSQEEVAALLDSNYVPRKFKKKK